MASYQKGKNRKEEKKKKKNEEKWERSKVRGKRETSEKIMWVRKGKNTIRRKNNKKEKVRELQGEKEIDFQTLKKLSEN